MDNAVNDKLNILTPHFTNIHVMLLNGNWTVSADKKVDVGVEIKIRTGDHKTAEEAVDDLYAKVLAIHNQTPSLPAL